MKTNVTLHHKPSSTICTHVLRIVFSNSTTCYNVLSAFRFVKRPLYVDHQYPEFFKNFSLIYLYYSVISSQELDEKKDDTLPYTLFHNRSVSSSNCFFQQYFL